MKYTILLLTISLIFVSSCTKNNEETNTLTGSIDNPYIEIEDLKIKNQENQEKINEKQNTQKETKIWNFIIKKEWVFVKKWETQRKFFNADPETFAQYKQYDKISKGWYYDKDNFYFSKTWLEWHKIEMDVKKIKKIDNSMYLTDGKNIYFDNREDWIIKLETPDEKTEKAKYIWLNILAIDKTIYYKWKNQSKLGIDLNLITINENLNCIEYKNSIFLPNFWELTEIREVDIESLIKMKNWYYQDKNYTYKIIDWKNSFKVEKVPKEK